MLGQKFRSDRISNLPSDLRDCILSHLPLRDAVRTSVLSTQWRYNWLTIPQLAFDWDIDGHEFIVSHVLRIHKGPITKFSFVSSDCFGCDIDIVDGWFQCLSSHSGIEELKLHLEGGSEYVLPQSLFSFQHMRHLDLKDVEIKLPSTFKGFDKLVTLTLEDVWNVFDMLKTLTSKCPMLEFLYVHSFDIEPGRLDIAAPNLEKFHFRGLFSSIYLKCPRIKEVSLDFDCGSTYMEESLAHDNFELPYLRRIKNNLVKVFCQMPSIEHVKLDGNDLMQFMAVGGVPQELPYKLNHLTRLDITAINLGCEGVVSAAVCLIRSSPDLKCLQISSNTNDSMPGAIQYLKAQQQCEVHLCCLKSVELHNILNTEPDMEFIKLIFLWASALEKLQVRTFGRWIWLERIKILQRLASFHRSSSNAVLTVT